MAEQKNNREIYAMLLSLREEVKQLTVQIRALRKEMKGDQEGVKKE